MFKDVDDFSNLFVSIKFPKAKHPSYSVDVWRLIPFPLKVVSGREQKKWVDDGSTTKVLAPPGLVLEGDLVTKVAWFCNVSPRDL